MTKEIKPDTAPTNISPSKPRFKTPLFSVINSPIPAKTKGVVDIKTILTIPNMRSKFILIRLYIYLKNQHLVKKIKPNLEKQNQLQMVFLKIVGHLLLLNK